MSDLTKTTDDQMYQMLFRAIHEHYLKPDTHLPEDELAKVLMLAVLECVRFYND